MLTQNAAIAQGNGKNIALVIGNTQYTQLPILRNASNDALSVAQALSGKGFTVFLAQDVTAEKLKQTLYFVAKQATNATRILIYYAGHSEMKGGSVLLLPVDSKSDPAHSGSASVSVAEILGYFDTPFAQKAIIIDACLETAVDMASQTLYLPKLGLETLLVFATSFGHAAYDGSGVHSVFTGALLDHMARVEFDLQKTVQKVRKEVIQTSRTNQIPVSVSTLTQPYILSGERYASQPGNLIQSYSSSGYADKPLLDTLSLGVSLTGF